MTLIEKVLPKMYCYFGSGMLTNTYDENIALQNAKECEKIADDYAIEFGNWLDKNQCDRLTDGRWLSSIINFNKSFTTEELLEIFKKEKGL